MLAVQIIAECKSDHEASCVRDALALQLPSLGGRIIRRGAVRRVQWFFDVDELAADCPLPDGCTLVVIPDSQRDALGIN
jgi:hypothetical protein